MSIAQFIDHTVLKPVTTLTEVERTCNEAVQYSFAAVCVPPVYVQQAARLLNQKAVGVATVIGFPFGYTYIAVKEAEIKRAIEDGADELDVVINLAALKNGDEAFLKAEVAAVSAITRQHNKTLKLIIESGILSDDEIINCCELYKNYPVQFLKTSTGYAEKGATVEAVQLMRKNLPAEIQIKASGGIKTFKFASELIEAGATRLGCSASIAIVNNDPSGVSTY